MHLLIANALRTGDKLNSIIPIYTPGDDPDMTQEEVSKYLSLLTSYTRNNKPKQEPDMTTLNELLAQTEQISKDVLIEKYCKAGETTAEEVYARVAKGLAQAEKPEEREKWEHVFHHHLKNYGVGAGRIMSACGTDVKATLSNCFVQGISDTFDPCDENGTPGIIRAVEMAVRTMSRGGGVGYNFSKIRPKKALVRSTLSTTSGACSFIDIFDIAGKTVESAGCFQGSTLIDTTEGLVTVKEIVESTKDWYVNTHLGPRKVTAKFDNGVKQLWKITTKYGYTLTVTPQHKFAQLSEGKIITRRLNEIIYDHVRDVLLYVPSNIPAMTAEWTLEEKEAYCMGAFLGNGSWIYYINEKTGEVKYPKGISISNNTTKEDIHDKIIQFFTDLGQKVSSYKRPNENTLTLSTYSTELCGRWIELGVLKGDDMVIPEKIKRSSKNVQAAFLAGIFEADGYICEGKSNIILRMVTRRLMKEIQVLLTSLGIPAKLYTSRVPMGDWKQLDGIGIYGTTAQLRFNATVGAYMNKVLEEVSSRNRVGYGHKAVDVLSFGNIKNDFSQWWSGSILKHPNISITEISEVCKAPELLQTISDQIAEIEVAGEERVYDLEVEEVHLLCGDGIYTSNSRRGAEMCVLNVDHPDIYEFITAKRQAGRWSGFNASVNASDAFMQAVRDDTNWELVHEVQPHPDHSQGCYQRADGKWVYQVVSARSLFDTITKSTYNYAEPGILFFDQINRENPLHYCEHLDATNPCVTGDTRLHTQHGMSQIVELHEQKSELVVTVDNRTLDLGEEGVSYRPAVPAFMTATVADVYRVQTKEGYFVKGTRWHDFYTTRGKIKLKELVVGDQLYIQSGKGQFGVGKIENVKESVHTLIVTDADKLPDEIFKCNEGDVLAYLGELYQHLRYYELNGDAVVRAGYSHYNKGLLQDIQILLANLGVYSEISPAPHRQYTLTMVNGSMQSFFYYTGCTPTSSEEGIVELYVENQPATSKRSATIDSIEYIGQEAVYDTTQVDHNSVIFNGIVTGQCGEQPLPPYGCCDLGPLILTRFVKNAFTEEASFDFDRFDSAVAVQTRMLDNVLDITLWPLEEQRIEAMNKRRIGVGYTGLGDALIMLNIRYDSEEGIRFAERVVEHMRDCAYKTSTLLAAERGAFPLLDVEKYLTGPFVSRLPEKIKDSIRINGIRNSHLLSIAPTGTVSLAFADNVSNGIEPAFSWVYSRKKVGPDGQFQTYQVMDYAFKTYVKEVLSKQESEEYCVGFVQAVSEGKKEYLGKPVKKILPSAFVTALEIGVEHHLKMLFVTQPYIDSSISKCVAEGTRIMTNQGLLKVEDLGGAIDPDTFAEPLPDLKVICPDGQWRKVTKHYYGGVRSTIKIRLDNGQEIEGSEVHKLMTPYGWTPMGELNYHDYICIRRDVSMDYPGGKVLHGADFARNAKEFTIPEKMSPELAMFFGMICADGHLQESAGLVSLTKNDQVVGSLFSDLCKTLFNAEIKHRIDPRNNVHYWQFTSRAVVRWIKNLIGYRSDDKHAPEAVMSGSQEEMRAFLAGVSLDGYRANYTSGGSSATVIYMGRSKELADNCFSLLNALGYAPRGLTKRVSGYDYLVYGVRCYGFEGCLQEHKNTEHVEPNELIKLPLGVNRGMFSAYSQGYKYMRSIEDRGQPVSREQSVRKYLTGADSPRDTFVYRKITSIERGQAHVYDIEVEESHDYLIDGVVSHNTVNIPEDYPFEDFQNVYWNAWEGGLKGVSTYRPNPVRPGILTAPVEEKKEEVVAQDTWKETVGKYGTEHGYAAVTFKDCTFFNTPSDADARTFDLDKLPPQDLPAIKSKRLIDVNYVSQSLHVCVSFARVRGVLGGQEYFIYRPVEFFVPQSQTDVPPEWVTSTMRDLSLMARSGTLFAKALQDKQHITWSGGQVRCGYTTLDDGTKKPIFHKSDVAAIAWILQDILITGGYLDHSGRVLDVTTLLANQAKRRPYEPLQYDDTHIECKAVEQVATSVKANVPTPLEVPRSLVNGKKCPECHSMTLVKRDGCEKCDTCGYTGSCG